MQKPLLPVRVVKLPRLKGGGLGPRTETCVNSGGSITLVPCVHQSNIYFKRQPGVWRDQKRIPLVSSKTPLTCSGRQTTRSQGRPDRAENGNLPKLWTIYRLGTVFAPRQDLYQKGARGMERPEMYSFSRCKTPHTCGGSQSTLSEGRRYRAENGNLRKLGRIYCLSTVFAPR